MDDLRAGAGVVALDLPLGTMLGGYAARTDPSVGELDPLTVRALVLERADTRVILVVFDTLYAPAELSAAVRGALATRWSVPQMSVLVSAIHTHAGPRDLTWRSPAPLIDLLVLRAVAAVDEAQGRIEPARLVVQETAVVGLAHDRRDSTVPPADRASTVAVEAVDGDGTPTGRLVASLVNYACHPTVLDHETLATSADFVGPMRASVETALGGVCLFLQGFAGDLNPAFVAQRPADALRAGALVAGAVVSTLADSLTAGRILRVINLSLGREVEVGTSGGTEITGGPLGGVIVTVDATARARDEPRPAALAAAVEAERWISGLIAHDHHVFNSMDFVGTAPGLPIALEVQALRLGGDLILIAFPGEPFRSMARELADLLPEWRVLTVGYANQAPAYLPPAAEYDLSGYEVGCSLVSAGSAERLRDAIVSRVNAETSRG